MSSSSVIRDPEFAKRLGQACDANFHCPELHKGRLTWLADQMGKRLKKAVSAQTCARWINGEAKPRRDKNDVLAELLGVDPIWLYLGVEQDITPRERKVRNALADGAVNLIAGLIQMDGGYPAFPEEKDARAQREHVDLYAVIKGANYAFHVALATPAAGNHEFKIPKDYENIVVLGVVRENFAFRIIELTEEMILSKGTPKGSVVSIILTDSEISEGEITGFNRRL